MRNLSVVAILSRHFCCMFQPAGADPHVLRQGQSPRRPPASPRVPRLLLRPHPFTQSPWSPGAQTPQMWGQDPATGTSEEVPRQRR